MRTKYKTQTVRYKDRLKKHVEDQTSTIISPFKLSENELEELKRQFPTLSQFPITNIVDTKLIAGIVLKIGTQRIDLSLSRGLTNLKQFLYDHSQ